EVGDDVAEGGDGLFLPGVEFPGNAVQDAQGAEVVASGGADGGAGVEADAGISRYQRVGGEPFIFQGVFDFEDVILHDRVGAKGDVARGLGGGDADLGLEPLAVFVHERNYGDGRF